MAKPLTSIGASQILDRETLAPSLDLDRIRSLIDTFLTAPIEPYSVEDYSLGQGLDHVTQFGLMYGKIADGWRKHGRPRGWIDQVGPAIDTGRLVNLTKAYAVGVSKLAVRVRALYDKVGSLSLSPFQIIIEGYSVACIPCFVRAVH